jgi:hypothetical protein
VLDVLAPPYSPHHGRDCTYYAESSPPSPDDAHPSGTGPRCDALLEEAEHEDFVTRAMPYTGPSLVPPPPRAQTTTRL